MVSVRNISTVRRISVRNDSTLRMVSVRNISTVRRISVRNDSTIRMVSVRKSSIARMISVRNDSAITMVSVRNISIARMLLVRNDRANTNGFSKKNVIATRTISVRNISDFSKTCLVTTCRCRSWNVLVPEDFPTRRWRPLKERRLSRKGGRL